MDPNDLMVFASCFQTSKPLSQFVTPIEDLRVLSWVNDPVGGLPEGMNGHYELPFWATKK